MTNFSARMRYQERKESGLVHLISVGHVPAITAAELKPGMFRIYNYGSKSEVLQIAPASPKFVTITLRHADGRIYTEKRANSAMIPVEPKS